MSEDSLTSEVWATAEKTHGNYEAVAIVMFEFARQLERELNAANAANAALSGRTVSCSNCNALAAENAAMREVINELYPQMQKLIDNGHHDLCKLLNYANAECDCGVQPATATLSKLQPYLK